MDIVTLYPPLVDTYMPAFEETYQDDKETSKCKVYFSISSFNTKEEIGKVMITVTNQDNNISALDSTKYPNSIKIYDNIMEDEKGYYIVVKAEDLKEGFKLNKYYKIQFRFVDLEAAENYDKTLEGSWLNKFKAHFSEWSTICLIKKISNCRITQSCFLIDSEGNYYSNNDMFEFSGALIFDNETEKETLNNYRIRLFADDIDNKELLVDSGVCYSNNYNNINQIYYKSNYSLIADNDSIDPDTNKRFKVEIEILTKNSYSLTEAFSFQMAERTCYEELDQNFIIIEDEENARIGVYYGSKDIQLNIEKGDMVKYPFEEEKPNEEEPTDSIHREGDEEGTSYLIFRRASAKTDFKEWETIYVVKEKEMNNFFFDYSIESGIPYKYRVQRVTIENSSYRYSQIRKDISKGETKENIHICLYEYMYLVTNNKQLKISLNHKVSSPKINISEARMDTIGSTYSFIKRNSAMRYRQYQISGTISFLDDEDSIFTSDKEIFNNHETIYQEFNDKNRITKYNDFVKEREYRKLVEDFLYEDNLKLVKTLTEGNVLGKLMEISFSPNQTLSNYVYDFSATIYENDENSLSNLHKYKVITTATDLPELETKSEGIPYEI